MKFLGSIICLFIICSGYHADAAESSLTTTLTEAVGIKDPQKLLSNQMRILDVLIETTQRSLDSQQKLKQQIADYQRVQDAYLKDTTDKDTLIRMVRQAARVLDTIKEAHLTQEFDPEFISELTLFSQIANKRGIPKS